MFGYVRPNKDELKVRELEDYRACYCGLCHALKKDYGFRARFVLNYDFVFMAMLLTGPEERPERALRRCAACGKKKCVSCASWGVCAGYSLILSWWKLKDAWEDEKGLKRLAAGAGLLLLRGAHKKAAAEFPGFEEKVSSNLARLWELEKKRESSLDRPADAFARILSGAGKTGGGENRAIEQLLYQLGRWIYITDACDDLERDLKSGAYNPVAERFGLSGKLPEAERKYLETTLLHSVNLISSAYELLPENCWSGILRNIIYLGLPAVTCGVLNGAWKNRK